MFLTGQSQKPTETVVVWVYPDSEVSGERLYEIGYSAQPTGSSTMASRSSQDQQPSLFVSLRPREEKAGKAV